MAHPEEKLHADIPIAASMDFRILSCSPLETTAMLPLEVNRNHLNTLFGGSLYSASALGCYSCILTWLEQEGIRAEVVIVEGSIKYLHPGRGDSEVKAWTRSEELEQMAAELRAKKKARIPYEATLTHQGKVISRFKGLYQILVRG